MTKWSQWSLIFIARCILKAATSCTQPKRNVKNRTENPFKLTLSLPFLGPRSVRSSFFLACPGLGLWFEPLGCCKRFVLRSTAIPMDSYGICCSNVFPYVNKCIYIYIIDIIYVCMQCWSHICIYIYMHDPVVFHPGFGVFAEIATSCIVFTSGIPRIHTKRKDAEDQNRVKLFSFEIIMAGTFPTVQHVGTQQRQHRAIPTPSPQAFWTAYYWRFWRLFWRSDQFVLWSDSARRSIVILNAKICCRLMSYLQKCPGCWDDAATSMLDFARFLENCQLTNTHDAVQVFEAWQIPRGLCSI